MLPSQALLGKGTRESMIRWMAAVIEGNRERAKMRWDPKKGASHGFFWNFNQVGDGTEAKLTIHHS
jgi:hypothetical protein